jgi:putative ABC transport system ATP-binding protein
MKDKLAEVVEVSKSYRLGEVTVPALRNVSLAIRPGEFAALAGPSGSGKTTLLNLIGCLDTPDAGEVRHGTQSVAHLPSRALARIRRDSIGFVFQTFNLVPVLTAFENVEYPLLLNGAGRAERRRRVATLLERVGLGDKMHRKPDALSGGERQRVATARALVNRPSLVLADEPTASLDSATGAMLLDLMHDLRDQYDVAFLFASHDPRLLARVDRVVSLCDGRIDAALAPIAVTAEGRA